MRIRDVGWSKAVRDKVESQHGLAEDEVESAAFERKAWIKRAGPDRYILLGRAASGAYVTLIFAYHRGTARVITARRMDEKERRIYQRSGK
jgi:uncharacterized DUF497 family protein